MKVEPNKKSVKWYKKDKAHNFFRYAPDCSNISRTICKKYCIYLFYKSIKNINYENITSGSNYAKISIIGTGIQNSPGYAAKFFEALLTCSSICLNIFLFQDLAITDSSGILFFCKKE